MRVRLPPILDSHATKAELDRVILVAHESKKRLARSFWLRMNPKQGRPKKFCPILDSK